LTGSHIIPLSEDESFWKNNVEMAPAVSFETIVGDVVLFDLRLLHRGTPNLSDTARNILYVSYVRSWYMDPSNFKRPQSRRFDTLDKSTRKLFTRVDSKTYTKQLETLIEEMLGTEKLKQMRSRSEYAQRSVRL